MKSLSGCIQIVIIETVSTIHFGGFQSHPGHLPSTNPVPVDKAKKCDTRLMTLRRGIRVSRREVAEKVKGGCLKEARNAAVVETILLRNSDAMFSKFILEVLHIYSRQKQVNHKNS